MLPTLLKKGYIVPKENASEDEKKRIKNTISLDYITNFIGDRTPMRKGSAPKKQPKSMGDRVIILKSGTGTGKSTALPPELYRLFFERTKKEIGVTQPRVLTAMDIPMGLPRYYPELKMDINLGFNTGGYKRIPRDKGLVFMTTGVLLQQMISSTPEEFMKKYQFILIDEVHERSVDVDTTLYMLKRFLEDYWNNVECPIIVLMSATFHPKLFMDYFGCPEENYIEVTGATFPIEDNYTEFDIPNYSKYAVSKAKELHIDNIDDLKDENTFRDIIIFVHNNGAVKKIITELNTFNSSILSKELSEVQSYIKDMKIEVANEILDDHNKVGGSSENYYIAPITLTGHSFHKNGVEYQNLFSDIQQISIPVYKMVNGAISNIVDKWVKPSRRIIVSTNIAETGVTIETLKYCIDTGYVFSVTFNPEYNSTLLISKNVTKSMAVQRRGRVGRKSPGKWYACYTKEIFDKLTESQFSEMLLADMFNTVLNIIIKETGADVLEEKDPTNKDRFQVNYVTHPEYMNLFIPKKLNFSNIDLIEMPSSQSLISACERLYGLG